MNVGTMRWIDRFVGIPLCLITGLLARAGSRLRGPRRRERSAVIVVIKMFGLGSILLSFPFLAALRRMSPDAQIVFVTFASNVALLERLPFRVQVLAIRTSSFTAFSGDALLAIRRLRRLRPRAVYDLEFFSKFSTLLSTLTGAPRRHGYDLQARWRRLNVTDRVPFRDNVHVTETFLSQLGPATGRAEGVSIEVRKPDDRERHGLFRLLLAEGLDRRRIVGVNLNAGTTSLLRRWPPDRFAETLLEYLARNPASAVVLTGDASEWRYVQDFLETFPALAGKAWNFAGRVSLGEYFALVERMEWLLTNDSAPMHIAAALGTPVIALFGPESPVMYAPPGRATILYAGLPCSPCLSVYRAKQFRCPYNVLCMRSLTTADVLLAIREIETVPQVRSARA